MRANLRQAVEKRAQFRCEYCQFPLHYSIRPAQIDHIIAVKHGGATDLENLALVSYHCNLRKGPNIAGLDPMTKAMVRLFHPRSDNWGDHFRWKGSTVEGLTPEGRATIEVLSMNDRLLVATREELINEGVFPQSS